MKTYKFNLGDMVTDVEFGGTYEIIDINEDDPPYVYRLLDVEKPEYGCSGYKEEWIKNRNCHIQNQSLG